MNAFSKYGSELLSKMGMKTNSSGDSLVSLPQSMKKAKFVKRFDMKVTTLQSYGLLRRDTPSPTQTNDNGSESGRNKVDTAKDTVKVHTVHSHQHPRENSTKERITHVNEYPIDPHNVVASIHRNINLHKQFAVSDHVTFIESRDDDNVLETHEVDNGRDGDTVDSRCAIEENEKDDFVLDDDDSSVDSIWNDCIQATCNLSVDGIYNDDELLGLAFVRD